MRLSNVSHCRDMCLRKMLSWYTHFDIWLSVLETASQPYFAHDKNTVAAICCHACYLFFPAASYIVLNISWGKAVLLFQR